MASAVQKKTFPQSSSTFNGCQINCLNVNILTPVETIKSMVVGIA